MLTIGGLVEPPPNKIIILDELGWQCDQITAVSWSGNTCQPTITQPIILIRILFGPATHFAKSIWYYQNIWTLTNLHWLSVNHRWKLGMRRISKAGIEAMAVQIVVDHWRLGRASATPRHWSWCCATYTVLSNTTGSSSVTVLKTFIYFG